MGYTAAVITVSDKGARGERVDTSGPRLVSVLKEHGYDVRYTAIGSRRAGTDQSRTCQMRR